MRVVPCPVLALAALLAGCQSNAPTANDLSRPAAPSGVTVRVINASCATGPCDSMYVLGFPSNGPITPGGLWSINFGLVTTPSACLTLPPADTARVTSGGSDGIARTTLFIWTPATSLSLGAIGPGGGRLMASPTTTAFVPTNAAGWQVTLPGGTAAVADSACGS